MRETTFKGALVRLKKITNIILLLKFLIERELN